MWSLKPFALAFATTFSQIVRTSSLPYPWAQISSLFHKLILVKIFFFKQQKNNLIERMTLLLRKCMQNPAWEQYHMGWWRWWAKLLVLCSPQGTHGKVERRGGWIPVLSLTPHKWILFSLFFKWLPALNPFASSSHPLCDAPFPNLHLPEHFRGCACPQSLSGHH